MNQKNLPAQISEQHFVIETIEAFNERLNKTPDPSEVQVNAQAGNSKYLPISYIEMELDELFLGLWETENFRWSVMANEVVGALDLKVFHPIVKQWIRRSGAAAVMIQQKSQTNGGTGDITDIGQKIKNTLVKDFPHLESECIKSAAKKLGKAFGRDLNRKFEDTYTPVYTQEAELSEDLESILEKLSVCKTEDAVKGVWEWYPQFHKNKKFKQHISARKRAVQIQK